MDVLTSSEIRKLVEKSELVKKYNQEINRESAYEMLTDKIKIAQQEENQEKLNEVKRNLQKVKSRRKKSTLETISKNTMVRQLGRTVLREVTRGLLGALGIKRR
jgi:protein subunit release factor B